MDHTITLYPEHSYAVLLWQYFPPVFIIIGTCGNLLTIVVLIQRKNRKSATSIYLTTLASCDLIALWIPLLTQWINYTFNIDFMSLSSAHCKIFFFLSYFSFQCSSSMIVAVTSERTFSVLLPHKVKNKCSPRNAIAVSFVTCACLLLLNVHWLFGVGVKTINTYEFNTTVEQSKCRPLTEASTYFIETVWPWIDLSIFYLIPLIVLISGSIAIIVGLHINTKKRQNHIAPANTSSNNQTSRNGMSSQISKMILVLDIVFFLCTTPVTIYMTIFTDTLYSPEQRQRRAMYELWWAIVNMLMFLNNTVNFILYFLSGSRFRTEVKSLLCRKQSGAVFATTVS